MDRLDMAIELILEAHSWENRDKVYRAYSPTPKKSVVNDNLKMACHIIIGEYMK